MRMQRQKNGGYSLITLLIASVIGLIVMGGIGGVYMSSQNTYRFREAVALGNENASFATNDLRYHLVMAGREIPSSADSPTNYADDVDDGDRTFPLVAADGSSSGSTTGIVDKDDNGSSIIAVRYASGPAPCSDSAPVTATTTVRFYIDQDADGEDVLYCERVEAGVKRPMVSGIVRMRVLYGVDTDDDGFANQYLSAQNVAGAQWATITAIRVGMIVRADQDTEVPSEFQGTLPSNMNLLGSSFALPDTTHHYKSVNTTVVLRNLNTTVSRQ